MKRRASASCFPAKDSKILPRKLSLSLNKTPSVPAHFAQFVAPTHLLNSNAPPSDSERTSIQKAIDTVSNEISATSEPALGPKADSTRRETGLKFIQTHKAILSPLRVLPSDVLAEIICISCDTLFWDSHPTSFTFSPEDNVRLPWAASQVSRLWRSTALSLHHLWGQIVVDTCLWEGKPPKAFLSLFSTLLSRSQQAPLRIHFCTSISNAISVKVVRPIIDALVSHSERWDTLHLISESLVIEEFQSVKGRLPCLRKLSLMLSVGSIPSSQPIDMFEHTPQLRSVSFWRDSTSGDQDLKLPWEQLRVFHDTGGSSCNGYSRKKVIPLLQSSVDVRVAEFSIDDIRTQWPATTMHHLQTLHIYFDDLDDAEFNDNTVPDNFLPSLTVPAIQCLKVINYPGNIIPTLTSLIERSYQCCTTLQDLSFSTYSMHECEPGELSSLLQLTPHLKKLSICLPSVVDLSRLVVDPDIPPLLPCLEELYIFIFSHEDFFWGYEDVVMSLAESRCEVPDDSTASTHSLGRATSNSTTCRLNHFRIISHSTFSCHTIHEALEHRHHQAGLESQDSDKIEELIELRAARHDNLSTLFKYFVPRGLTLGAKMIWAWRTAWYLTRVEGLMDRMRDEDLYTLNIHHLMHHISNLSSSDLPGESIYHFRKRARALLDKWEPFLCDGIEHRRWAFQGVHSIVYVPRHDAIRSSQDVLKEMIYGNTFEPRKYSETWYDSLVALRFVD